MRIYEDSSSEGTQRASTAAGSTEEPVEKLTPASTGEKPSPRSIPLQIWIGFLQPPVSKKDAVNYAIGVADRNSTNVLNTAYAIYAWNGGWAYEVHEGGARRAYLPQILKHFDEQAETTRLDDQAVTIRTTQRMVRVVRTQTGLSSLLMPESFAESETAWLAPGARLKPAASLRMGVLAGGLVVFAAGFLALFLSLWRHFETPLPAPAPPPVAYRELPLSQWPQVQSAGYVSALRYRAHRWQIDRMARPALPRPPVTVVVPSPKVVHGRIKTATPRSTRRPAGMHK